MPRDRWAEWLAERRFGGDDAIRREFMVELTKTRERVLDNAALAPGETLLDVGCGDGLIAFGAIERGAGTVIFGDISDDLLEQCRAIAADLGVLDRCRFVQAAADELAPIEAASVDVVTTRSVLIYVKNKQRAFDEFFRVLRADGRVSLFEPINRLYRGFRDAYDIEPVRAEADKVWALFERLQPPDTDPMLDFDERDLVDLADRAGFEEVCLELEIVARPAEARPWQTLSRMAGNPNIPTLGEAIEQTLSTEEADRFVSHLRPLVERGEGRWRDARAYLRARK